MWNEARQLGRVSGVRRASDGGQCARTMSASSHVTVPFKLNNHASTRRGSAEMHLCSPLSESVSGSEVPRIERAGRAHWRPK